MSARFVAPSVDLIPSPRRRWVTMLPALSPAQSFQLRECQLDITGQLLSGQLFMHLLQTLADSRGNQVTHHVHRGRSGS